MKLKHLSIILAMLMSCFISVSIKAQQKTNIIKEGVGIENLTVGKSNKKDVEKKFGKDYKWTANKNYSYQMIYPNGVSFYICQADKRQEIFDIEIRSPYQAKTSRGITLRKSTLDDVRKIYGTAKKGLRYRGIEFYYRKSGGKDVVTVIDVVEKTGLRQCTENK
ncbi:MAG: DUF4309 domain-containing protein [Pyrinomonadaceae bacterium]